MPAMLAFFVYFHFIATIILRMLKTKRLNIFYSLPKAPGIRKGENKIGPCPVLTCGKWHKGEVSERAQARHRLPCTEMALKVRH